MKARTRYRILFLLLAAALLAAAFSLPVLADLEEETVDHLLEVLRSEFE